MIYDHVMPSVSVNYFHYLYIHLYFLYFTNGDIIYLLEYSMMEMHRNMNWQYELLHQIICHNADFVKVFNIFDVQTAAWYMKVGGEKYIDYRWKQDTAQNVRK